MDRFYSPILSKEIWIGRQDAHEFEYVFQHVHCQDITKITDINSGYGLIGFESDTGIRRNHGNPGAALGPQAFRSVFAKLATPKPIQIFDMGNIGHIGHELEAAQLCLSQAIQIMMQHDLFPIVIGGGHETAFGHYLGLKKHFPKEEIAIINFDAHFDLRPPLEQNKGSSGTPFRQIQEYLHAQQQPFYYYCAGIQPFANTRSLFEYAHQHQVQYQLAEDIHQNPFDLTWIETILERHSKIYVTLCMDVFSSAISPGVSAPQCLGINPTYVINALKKLKKSQKVIGLDIVELSPPYDTESKTAKLAANLLMNYLYA